MASTVNKTADRRYRILMAFAIGCLVGFLCAWYVGLAVNLGTSLTRPTTVVLWLICPTIYSIWWNFWLVPILNGGVYAAVFLAASRWLVRRKPAALLHLP